ncbi:hypothetical protein SHI21_14865 [Bacteriovorax sp. PP10]|uniref:Lipoprotein n=1 Tax=Bacteriovorax antarcticus TaxID=3088717 RepID=A0ABU5VX26_9BACT|nr:hypothetical protein [Bacteriovorax sp. PP10]MEA9357507.1 hypothetical protein [Bacteriovorax sp. PP10]
MKYTKTLILLGALLLTVSCKKDDVVAAAAAGAGGGGGGTTTKELFSTVWSVSNNAWELNWGAGNLVGTPFTSQVTYAGGGTCTCTTTIAGTQSAGTYLTDCSVNTPVSGVPNAGTCDGLDYTPTGSYTNTGGYLTLCRSSGSCSLVYH